MKIISWNVNGIRAAIRNGLIGWVETNQPDVLCLQEVKAKNEQSPDQEILDLGYKKIWNSGLRPGYSGTAIYTKLPVNSYSIGIDGDGNDPEGRVIRAEIGGLAIYNVYFPNGQRGLDRLDFKLDFYASLLKKLTSEMVENPSVIVCGDFNTAHHPIDLANPKENETNSGFLPIERTALTEYFNAGFVDVFREKYPEKQEYTWWTYRFNARVRGIGWRIDYFLAHRSLYDRIGDIKIMSEIPGSDHCPVSMEIE